MSESAWTPVLERVEVTVPGLPAFFDGFRILHVSDSHLDDTMRTLADRTRGLLTGVEVDLVAFTGDANRGNTDDDPESGARLLAHALSGVRSRHGTLAILGNHDPAGMAESLEGQGMRMLINEHWLTMQGTDALRLTGTDDPHQFWTPACDAAPKGLCRIALSHAPEGADAAVREGFALFLCGHTHGGQVCLRRGSPLAIMSRAPVERGSGLWRLGGMVGHTSCGLGTSGLPLRVGCPAAATILVLCA